MLHCLVNGGFPRRHPPIFICEKAPPAQHRPGIEHTHCINESFHRAHIPQRKKLPCFPLFFAHQVLPMPAPCGASVISLLALCSLIRLRYSIYFSNCTGTPSVVFLYIACTIKHNTYDPSQSIITCTILVGYCTITSITKSYMCK